MAQMIQKFLPSIVKSADETTLTLEHFISTEEVDRHGDIVRASAFKIFEAPAVLLAHDQRGETIGGNKGLSIGTTPMGIPGIIAKTQYYDDEQGVGRRLFGKAKDGHMKWSIGFNVIKFNPIKGGGHEFTEIELLEYSQVSVPAGRGTGLITPNVELDASDVAMVIKMNDMGVATGEGIMSFAKGGIISRDFVYGDGGFDPAYISKSILNTINNSKIDNNEKPINEDIVKLISDFILKGRELIPANPEILSMVHFVEEKFWGLTGETKEAVLIGSVKDIEVLTPGKPIDLAKNESIDDIIKRSFNLFSN